MMRVRVWAAINIDLTNTNFGRVLEVVQRCTAAAMQANLAIDRRMIAEGVVALIWAAAAMTVFGGIKELAAAGSPAVVVNKASVQLLGAFWSISSCTWCCCLSYYFRRYCF